jgi:serine/threonine protein kinase
MPSSPNSPEHPHSPSTEATNTVPPSPPRKGRPTPPPPNSSNWQPDDILHCSNSYDYQIQKKLGEGGFAITYLAENLSKHRREVIKRLKPELKEHEQYTRIYQAFNDEYGALARCRSPFIVQVYGNGQFCTQQGEECQGLLMEYIEGQSLQKIVTSGPESLPKANIRRYLEHLVKAVETIHNQTQSDNSVLLHLDINPNNIIIRQTSDEAVLIDFGLASFCDSEQFIQHQCWLTEGYAPIEQYAEKPTLGTYTDIYAIAATAYFLFTGQAPPSAQARSTGQRLNETLILPEYRVAVTQGLTLDPQTRPQTIRDWWRLCPEKRQYPSWPTVIRLPRKYLLLLLLLLTGAGVLWQVIPSLYPYIRQLPFFTVNRQNWVAYHNAQDQFRLEHPPEWQVSQGNSLGERIYNFDFRDRKAKIFVSVRPLQQMLRLQDYWLGTVKLENKTYPQFQSLMPVQQNGLPPLFPLTVQAKNFADDSIKLQEHPAYRIDYEYFDRDQQRMIRAVEIVSVDNGRGIHLMLQSPSETFWQFEPTFLAIAQSLQLGVTQATP